MSTTLFKPLIFIAALGFAGSTFAIPTLQVGAPAGPGDTGIYADYKATLTNPTETDTAVTSGSTLLVGGVYSNGALLLGGRYTDPSSSSITPGIAPGTLGVSWSQVLQQTFGGSLSDYAAFNGRGAILVASVPDGTLGSVGTDLKINGQSAFYTSESNSFFPNNHDPVKDAVSDFLFFDIGNFNKNWGSVPNFADETGGAAGEIKTLLISTTGFQWIHFDVMALQTVQTTAKNGKKTVSTGLLTSLQNNPGSKDVTWKESIPPLGVPEPASPLLLGVGLLGLYFARRGTVKQGPKQS
ncbi:MAG: choice-of-anchor N protein [Gammaproteobacteria bacterium]|nr:choice-of-anchor N protein [Gammaproteobacteria bacterium]